VDCCEPPPSLVAKSDTEPGADQLRLLFDPLGNFDPEASPAPATHT
jgi:hypothetical protein